MQPNVSIYVFFVGRTI